MHGRMRLIALVLSAVGLALLMTGCPKRPGITVASAPPPAAPAPAPAAPAPAPAPLAAAPAPAPPAPAPAEEYKINDALKPVYFAFDSSAIRSGDAKTLDANAAMGYLVSRGIEAGRITMISYGKERPVCTEHDEACWSKNRRDNFLTKK